MPCSASDVGLSKTRVVPRFVPASRAPFANLPALRCSSISSPIRRSAAQFHAEVAARFHADALLECPANDSRGWRASGAGWNSERSWDWT